MRLAANILSVILHPFFLPTYAFLLINWAHPFLFAQMGIQEKQTIFFSIFLNTFIFPVVVLLLMKQLGFVQSLHLRTQKERILPYIAISLFYFWTFLVIKNLAISEFTTQMMLGASLAVFMAFFLNLFYKISVHAVGAGCFLGITLALTMQSSFNLFPILIITLITIGALGSARIFLKAHRATDIYSGYMIGLLGQIIAFKIL